jgi:lysophospholipase L1-like esterase
VRIPCLSRGACLCALSGKIPLFTALFLSICGIVEGASVEVVATGDSLTCMYWSSLPHAFNIAGVAAEVPNPASSIGTARGGLDSSAFAGKTAYPNESPINYGAKVLAADPDVILFMLGINDLNWDSGVEDRFIAYKANLGPEFDSFANFTNSRGQHPKVIIGSILPYDVERNEAYWTKKTGSPNYVHRYPVIDTIALWDGWLQQQSQQHGFQYLDNFSSIQQVPDWKSTLFGEDGLHLSDQGSQWVATQFADAAAVPEPSSLAILVGGGLGLFCWIWRRFGRAQKAP